MRPTGTLSTLTAAPAGLLITVIRWLAPWMIVAHPASTAHTGSANTRSIMEAPRRGYRGITGSVMYDSCAASWYTVWCATTNVVSRS